MSKLLIEPIRQALHRSRPIRKNLYKTQLSNKFYAFFDTSINEISKRYLSEDYTFCRRWQKIGGNIWLDPDIKLNHVGQYVFSGNTKTLFK